MGKTPNARRVRWLRLIGVAAAFIIISVGLGYLAQSLLGGFHIPVNLPLWMALLIIFGVLALVNLSALPVPIGVSIMLVAAMHWNPALVALAGSLGAAIGEFSSYFTGYLGKVLSIDDSTPGYKMVNSWVRKYGMWAIALLSFQPIIPFELGGFVAGVAKMKLNQFALAIWIGKFPKYLLLLYVGGEILKHLPFGHV